MYRKGLDYLVKTQTATGNWPDVYGSQPGVVGLSVVAMLAHGDDPNSGPYAQNIRRGLDVILNAVHAGNGLHLTRQSVAVRGRSMPARDPGTARSTA